jgi:hypothetical protein
LGEGDLLVTMGAGDVDALAGALAGSRKGEAAEEAPVPAAGAR